MSIETAINSLSAALSVPAAWVNNIISQESSWRPLAVNSVPYNQYNLQQGKDTAPKYAKGLIQFTDESAISLGFQDSQDLINQYPDVDSQSTGPVLSYLKQYAPYTTEQSFYMAVFNPSYMFLPPNTILSTAISASNPEFNTIQDYINQVVS